MVGARGAERVRLPWGEFQALWLGEAISIVGDQLAKVAVAMSVFDRTGSAAFDRRGVRGDVRGATGGRASACRTGRPVRA